MDLGNGQHGWISYSRTMLAGRDLPRWRSRLVLGVISALFLALGARAFWVQVGDSDFYNEQGRRRVQRTIEVAAARGAILDREQRTLAVSQRAASVFADPGEVPDDLAPATLARLAALLSLAPETLRERLSGSGSFVYLARQLPYEVGEAVAALRIPGIHRQLEWKRV